MRFSNNWVIIILVDERSVACELSTHKVGFSELWFRLLWISLYPKNP